MAKLTAGKETIWQNGIDIKGLSQNFRGCSQPQSQDTAMKGSFDHDYRNGMECTTHLRSEFPWA